MVVGGLFILMENYVEAIVFIVIDMWEELVYFVYKSK